MNDIASLFCKVLVHEPEEHARGPIREFCQAHNLLGLRHNGDDLMEVLQLNIDLGAIFLSEGRDASGRSGAELGLAIHQRRPDLPLFLRREGRSDLSSLAPRVREAFVAAYRLGDIDTLQEPIRAYIFNTEYPGRLVRGIQKVTADALQATFRDTVVDADPPYVVHDRLIYGEIFSLMMLETRWCRGYMMLQTEAAAIDSVIELHKTQLPPRPQDFRQANSILAEVSNLIWGGIRARFDAGSAEQPPGRAQVPIIINHERRYITFGNDDPQLCFRYTLRDRGGLWGPIRLYQKFVFNLSWAPERLAEAERTVEDCVEAGELELF